MLGATLCPPACIIPLPMLVVSSPGYVKQTVVDKGVDGMPGMIQLTLQNNTTWQRECAVPPAAQGCDSVTSVRYDVSWKMMPNEQL